MLAAVGALIMSSGIVFLTTAGTAQATPTVHKVFVCKYVGTPYVDERLQEANNPISVDVSALGKDEQGRDFTAQYPATSQFPFSFSDGQGRSVAFAWDPEQGDGQQNEPGLDQCPPPREPEADEIEVIAEISYREPTCADPTVGWAGSYRPDDSEQVLPANLVTFAVTAGQASPGMAVEITATIGDDDYEFDNESQAQVFTHTFQGVPTNCAQVVAIPAQPQVTDPCGPGNITFVQPADTAQLNWEPGANGSLVVTPIAPAVFAGGEQSKTFPLPADSGVVCPTSTTTPPAIVAPGEAAPPVVLGTESASPKQTKKPAGNDAPQVLGSEAAVPTAVDAGLGSLPPAAPAPGSLLGQLLIAGGIALMLAAGRLMMGRREIGAREA